MNIDSFGIPVFSEKDLKCILYSDNFENVFNVLCENSNEIEKFNKSAILLNKNKLNLYEELNVTIQEFDQIAQSSWMMPDKYFDLDVKSYLLNKTNTEIEKNRVLEEYEEYNSRNLINLLKYLIFLVDFMKKEHILWGVGRGSSVSSYILFLIGIHRIDSIKYQLEYKEFFNSQTNKEL